VGAADALIHAELVADKGSAPDVDHHLAAAAMTARGRAWNERHEQDGQQRHDDEPVRWSQRSLRRSVINHVARHNTPVARPKRP
jgi:endo-1,4-beta-D-glucanase Y